MCNANRCEERTDGVGRRLCRPRASSAVNERRSGNEDMVVSVLEAEMGC